MCVTQPRVVQGPKCGDWDDSTCRSCLSGETITDHVCDCQYNPLGGGCDPDTADWCTTSGCLCGDYNSCTNGNHCVGGECVCGNTSACTGTNLCDWDKNRCLSCAEGEKVVDDACSCSSNTGQEACDQTVADTCGPKGCQCGSGPSCINGNQCEGGSCVCKNSAGCSDTSLCDWSNSKCVSCVEGEELKDHKCSCPNNAESQACEPLLSNACTDEGCRCGDGALCSNNNQCVDGDCMCNDRDACTNLKLCDWENSKCLSCLENEEVVNHKCSCSYNKNEVGCSATAADSCTEEGCVCGDEPECENQNRCGAEGCSCNEGKACTDDNLCDWENSTCVSCINGEDLVDGACSCAGNVDKNACSTAVADSCTSDGCECGSGDACVKGHSCKKRNMQV